jgi:hypothetical protein
VWQDEGDVDPQKTVAKVMQNRDTTKYITYFFYYFTIQYLVLPKNSCSFASEIMNRKMKVKTILTLALAATTLAACHRGKKPPRMDNSKLAISLSKPAKGDRAIYGLACLGCSDTALVLLPNGGGDPVRYNILDATRNHQVFGDIEVGDWVCVMPCEEKDEKNRADMVIDLDQLKATWTYPVMPKLRDVSHLSKRQQARILANMPDSIVETYMVPRQYGFTLKRMSEAMAVGRVRINKDVDDDSPVEYPAVPQYTEWHAYNGKLILVQGHRELDGVVINEKTKRDTFTFVYMKGDSLALSDREGRIQGFHRSLDAMKANAKAHAAAEKLNSKMKKEILK